MTRRALLIASQTFGLRGANNDAAAVDALLADRDFSDRRLLTDHAATRDGILQAFRALIRDTVSGDPVLLYYSGHGGRIANPRHTPQSPREPAHYACIIPFDHTKEEFRGIFNSELAALLAELALRTDNITVVLDCCHAAEQVLSGPTLPKGATLVHKRIPIPWREDIAAHRDWLLAQGYDLSRRAAHIEAGPHQIRLHACAADQLAYEACREGGVAGGLLTTALLHVLATTPPDATWQALAHLIRAHVTARHATQIPELHGPLGRAPFTTDERPHTDILALTTDDGRHYLSGGALHGVTPKSRYLLMPVNANRPDRALALAEAEVLDVEADRARIALLPIIDTPTPVGTRAFLYDPKHNRHPIRLDLPPSPLRDILTETIAAAPRLRLAAPDAPPPIATLALEGDLLRLTDRDGHLVRAPWSIHHASTWPIHHPPLVSLLEQLARVRDLLDLPDPIGETRLDPPPTICWGVLHATGKKILLNTGAHLPEGDAIFLRVTSNSPAPIYISVLGVGVSRSIRLLTAAQPYGHKRENQQTYTLGEGLAGLLPGLPLVWSPDVPRSAPQPVHLLTLITDRPVDLRSLESSPEPEDKLERSLDELLDPAAHLRTRDFGEVPRGVRSARYNRIRISFSLTPSAMA